MYINYGSLLNNLIKTTAVKKIPNSQLFPIPKCFYYLRKMLCYFGGSQLFPSVPNYSQLFPSMSWELGIVGNW